MYTLTKGLAPSKIVASAHSRGPPRHLDSYENRDKSTSSSKSFNKAEGIDELAIEMSNPKPTFQQQRRTMSSKRPQPAVGQDSTLLENHQEMVTFLSKQWQKVQDSNKKEGENTYEVYKDRGEPKRPVDSNFQAFDLEKLWEMKQLKVCGKSTS